MESKLKAQRWDIADLFSAAWQLYNQHFSDILWIMLCVYVPVNLVVALLPVDWELPGVIPAEAQLSLNFALFLEFFVGIIATIALAALVEHAIQEEPLSWHGALRYGLARWLPAVVTELLAALIIMGLTFLLIIPGIIWAFYYAFAVYVVALRPASGRRALAYSKGLVQGQWWRVCGILLATSLIGQLALLVITGLLTLIADNPVADFIINSVADVVGAFFLVVTVLFFLNTDYIKRQEEGSPASD